MYSCSIAELVVFFDPSGLKVSSLFPRILKSVYSAVANKFVAFAPMAKIPAAAKTPTVLPNATYSLFLIAITT